MRIAIITVIAACFVGGQPVAQAEPSAYEAQARAAGAVQYWSFSGTPADGEAAGIRVQSAPPDALPGLGGGNRVAAFDGVASVLLPQRKVTDALTGAGAISFEAWFSNRDLQQQKLISLYTADAVSFEVYLNRASIYVAGRSQSGDPWRGTSVPCRDMNVWHHVVAVVDYDDAQIRIYLDGERVAEEKVKGWKSRVYNPSSSAHADSIGRRAEGGFHFWGLMDELAVYPHAIDRQAGPDYIQKRFRDGLGLEAIAARAEKRWPQPVRLKYNNPGLVVDAGVGLGAWPLPMDYDDDGDHDLIVVCNDVPHNGVYLFENTEGNVAMPVFEPPVRLGDIVNGSKVSHLGDEVRVLTPGKEYPDFKESLFAKGVPIPYEPTFFHEHFTQWTKADMDGDGVLDLLITAHDGRELEREKGYLPSGEWAGGPMHGYIYFVKNIGTNDHPSYAEAVQLKTDEGPVDVYGWPGAVYADWDHDGDLDIICGEFLDTFTYFENVGGPTTPHFARGRHLLHEGRPISIDVQMIWPAALDWDRDGDIDLIAGQEDGRIMFFENTGGFVHGLPAFLPGRFFQQKADELKVSALATPTSVDWDGDGDEDLICGDTAGRLSFVENLGMADGMPKWNRPVYLKAGGEEIRILAGYNGSIQGPCEAKWGYTVPTAGDWNHDGLPDLIVNSIWGDIVWYENVGTRTSPKLKHAQSIEVEWPGAPPKPAWNWWQPKGKSLAGQWRTTPLIYDLDRDGLNDLVMMDHEGYLAFFRRERVEGELRLLPGARVFQVDGPSVLNWNNDPIRGETPSVEGYPTLRLNGRVGGGSGRRKFVLTDWDGDGRQDLLVNSRSIDFMKNIDERPDAYVFQNQGLVTDVQFAGHTTCPTVVDWNGDGVPDLLFGGEDGCLYLISNPHQDRASASR